MVIIAPMLMEVMKHLQDAGIETSLRKPEKARDKIKPDVLLTLEMDGVRRTFVVEVKSRSPYPGELPDTIKQLRQYARSRHPLLVTKYVSASAGIKLSEAGWSWADQSGNFDIRAPQFRARQRLSTTPPKPSRPHLPQGSGALAVIRFLIYRSAPDQPFGHEELAEIGHVSQPRATQVLKRLRDQNLISGAGRDWVADRTALLETFLGQYRGPGGTEIYFYSLKAPTDAARELIQWAKSEGKTVAISADVGPDLIASWRRPTQVVAYLREPSPVSELELVQAKSRDDANIILRVPDDVSVFAEKHQIVQELDGVEIPLADVSQMIWDLKDLGGSDREEAADNLREWLLSSR